MSMVTAILNQFVSLGVAITRDNPTVKPSHINWTFEGMNINESFTRHKITEDRKSLTISNVDYEDRGVYTVQASNAAGQADVQIIVDILGMYVVLYQ